MGAKESEKIDREARNEIQKVNRDSLVDGDIKVLKDYLFKENKGKFISWLQKVSIEACYVKLTLTGLCGKDNDHIMEPTVYYHACKLKVILLILQQLIHYHFKY